MGSEKVPPVVVWKTISNIFRSQASSKHPEPYSPLVNNSFCIQRWVLTLSAYNFKIKYKPGSLLGNADSVSRLPLSDAPENVPMPRETIHLLDTLDNSPIQASSICQWTITDPVLSHVVDSVLHGWSSQIEDDFQPCHHRRHELAVEDNCCCGGTEWWCHKKGESKFYNCFMTVILE